MNEKSKIFDELLETFENEDLKEYGIDLISTIPDYFWEVGASSTGKYHPQYALGTLGLARHTISLVRIMNHLFNLEFVQEDFNSRERDLMRITGMMHDTRKSGDEDDYQKSKFTKFDHPLLAARVIRNHLEGISPLENEIIANTVAAHMGQWNIDKRSNVVLPKPIDKYQKLLHLCDYLASRKDIEMQFDNIPSSEPEQKLEDYRFTFGKYKGELLTKVAAEHRDYLVWMNGNLKMNEPLNTFVKKILSD